MVGAEALSGCATRAAMGEYACACGFERIHSLREKRADQAGEDVAGAGCSERRAAAGADRDRGFRRDDQGVVPLEYNDRAGLPGDIAGVLDSVLANGGRL